MDDVSIAGREQSTPRLHVKCTCVHFDFMVLSLQGNQIVEGLRWKGESSYKRKGTLGGWEGGLRKVPSLVFDQITGPSSCCRHTYVVTTTLLGAPLSSVYVADDTLKQGVVSLSDEVNCFHSPLP